FLRDVYEARKEAEYGFSYRAFAKRAGLRGPNYLKLVAEGQRNLTAEMAGRFAAALGLGEDAAAYFCDLVAFNQASTANERERCYQRLQSYRRYRSAFRLDAAHAAYHSEWYIPAIRELAACRGFRQDPKWIARRLRPSITARQAEQALSVLMQLGFLVRDAEGKLVQHEPALSTGDDQPLGHHIVTFHRTMLARAGEALDGVARDEREIASLTLSLDAAQFRDFKRRLYDLRQELLQLATVSPNTPDRVVQINFQMFPLSRADAAGAESGRVSPEENGTRV
ncbi:MAG TPA: TIGR02147 family protein, partial [Polyangiaceae bacterium]|nr:TIGR02147 family protein [Polyangiaceae bacterium]